MGGPPDVWGIELHDHSVILGKSTGKVMIQHPVSLAQKATVSLPKPIAEEFQERVENCKTRCFDSEKRGGDLSVLLLAMGEMTSTQEQNYWS